MAKECKTTVPTSIVVDIQKQNESLANEILELKTQLKKTNSLLEMDITTRETQQGLFKKSLDSLVSSVSAMSERVVNLNINSAQGGSCNSCSDCTDDSWTNILKGRWNAHMATKFHQWLNQLHECKCEATPNSQGNSGGNTGDIMGDKADDANSSETSTQPANSDNQDDPPVIWVSNGGSYEKKWFIASEPSFDFGGVILTRESYEITSLGVTVSFKVRNTDKYSTNITEVVVRSGENVGFNYGSTLKDREVFTIAGGDKLRIQLFDYVLIGDSVVTLNDLQAGYLYKDSVLFTLKSIDTTFMDEHHGYPTAKLDMEVLKGVDTFQEVYIFWESSRYYKPYIGLDQVHTHYSAIGFIRDAVVEYGGFRFAIVDYIDEVPIDQIDLLRNGSVPRLERN